MLILASWVRIVNVKLKLLLLKLDDGYPEKDQYYLVAVCLQSRNGGETKCMLYQSMHAYALTKHFYCGALSCKIRKIIYSGEEDVVQITVKGK